MRRITINLTDEQYVALERAAEQKQRSIAWMIRERLTVEPVVLGQKVEVTREVRPMFKK